MAEPIYRRVVIKLSGEYLAGAQSFGIDQPTVDRIAGPSTYASNEEWPKSTRSIGRHRRAGVHGRRSATRIVADP